ncbi:hypothetical protein O0L34_g363 [Tuta absoluta]|nr:hypothetical protein O0L34_g363 [Tuta absoluta]
MSLIKHGLLLVTTVTMALGQRGSFAGFRPIGYPDVATSTAVAEELGNRFGDDNTTSTTTQRLPIEANGDKGLVDRLSKLPIDQQPFWFINWQAIEANMKKPQTYPQRPSQFAGSQDQSQQDFNRDTSTSNFGSASEFTPPKTGGNRDVDVSSFLANNGSPNLSTNPPSVSTTAKQVEDTLANKFGNDPVDTKPAVTPTQNFVSTAPVVKPIQIPTPTYTSQASRPNSNYGQVVESFQTVPFAFNKYPAYPATSSRNQKEVLPTTSAQPRLVNGILTDDPDYPYPILDPKTRDPSLITHNARPLVNADPMLLRNRFRDYDFEEQGPIFAPYPYGGYYF